MADITSKMLDVRIGTSNDWAQENLSLVAGNLYYVDLMKNDGNPSGAMALFLAMGTTKADARYLTTLMPSALDASVTGDVAVGDTLVTALSKLNNKITSVAEDAAKMFTIRGTIGTEEDGGDRQGIPPTAEKGDAWRIVTEGSYTFNGKEEKLEVGDWIICSFVSSDNTPTWVVLQANLDLSSVTFEGSDIKDNGFEIKLSGAGINASTTVPFATASKGGLLSATDYSKLNTGTLIYKDNTATASDAGVVMLIDETDSDKSEGYAATPKAVKSVKDALDKATKTLTGEQKAIVKGIEVDNATHSTDSKKILVLDEAGQTFHADYYVLARHEIDEKGDSIGVRLYTDDNQTDTDIVNEVIVNEADHSALADAIVVEGKGYSVKAVEIDKDDTKGIRLQSTDENVVVLSVDRADLADDLGGRQETTPEEFIYQPTAGEYQSIKDGMASIKSLKGNSVVWNQKLEIESISSSSSSQIYENREAILTELSAQSNTTWSVVTEATLEFIKGHKYLTMFDAKSNIDGCRLALYMGFDASHATSVNYLIKSFELSTAYKPIGFIIDWNTQTTSEVTPITDIQYRKQSSGFDNDIVSYNIKNHVIIDLTQMFQEGNEPTTVEEYEARKPKVADEYAYNDGEIISFNGDAIKSVGFNQWDEEWESGKLNFGNKEESVATIRSKNYIRVLAGVQYALNKANAVFMCYDENYNFIEYTGQTGSRVWNGGLDINAATVSESIFTFPQGTVYTRFYLSSEYGTTYNHDICINLSHTGIRNGEYEPYTEHTLYLPSAAQDMKSAGTVYDEIYFDEAKKMYFKVQRMAKVDLGDLNWSIASGGPKPFFKGSVTGGLTTLGVGVMPNMIVSKKYNVVVSGYDSTERADKSITWQSAVSTIMLYDYDYTDVESLKASLQGVKLIYELAEPIITEITDYEGYMDYPVSDFGTEEVLSLGNTAPLKADIQYGFNAVDTIRNNRLDITQLKKEVVNANTTADEAKSLAENAEQDASKARESTQVLGDHLNNVTFSGNSVDNGYNIELSDGESTNNPTMPNGDSVNFGSSITIPKATASLNGVMSKEDKSWLDGVKNGTSSVAKADGVVSIYLGEMAGKTIATLKTAIDAIQSQYANKDAFIRIRFGAQNPFITAWNNNDVGYVIEAGQQWVLQPIGYVGAPNYVSWILSSYGADEHYIVVKNNTWGSIRRIAFTNSKVDSAVQADNALRANNATIANNALNAQKINVDVESNTIAFPEDHYEKISAVSVYGGETPTGERTVVINIGDTEGDVKSYGAQIAVVTDGTDGIIYRKKDEDNWKTIAFLDSKVASADKADKDGNGNNIAETYAKDTDLDAIKSALTWKPFTNN